MDWLDLDLPPQTAFHMEQQRRELQACNDPDVLRSFALGFLQQTHQMSSTVNQLIKQVATLEVEMARAGSFQEPSAEHYRWAQELRKDLLG